MTERDQRFPKPDRSNHTPQRDAKRESYPEIDCGRGEVVMTDGRPAAIEDWYDSECEASCRTVFYSTLETEDWSGGDHFAFIEASGLLAGKSDPGRSVGHKVITDASGNSIWSVTVVMRQG